MIDQKERVVLILGAGGMLGNTLFRYFFQAPNIKVYGTLRNSSKKHFFNQEEQSQLLTDIDVVSDQNLKEVISSVRPDIVINCIGIIKQLKEAKLHLESLSINSMLPHRLHEYCRLVGARLIHLSTDCVFSGKTGNYTEIDFPDSNDLYGRTKYLGEVDTSDSITLRTSIIGHELSSANSLVDWFLSQEGSIKGYSEAIFSGFPTVEIARIILKYIIPNKTLTGLYHLSADPISKFDLLTLIAKTYDKDISITMDRSVIIDRSLNSDRFRKDAQFSPLSWPEMVELMHHDFEQLTVRDVKNRS